MALGLQVMDEQGNVVLDLTNQMQRVIGQQTISGTGEITAASLGYPNNNLWYMLVESVSPSYDDGNLPVLRIDREGKRIFWQNQIHAVIRYGIY